MSDLVTLRPKPGDVVDGVYHVECELRSDAASVVLGAVVTATSKRYALHYWLDKEAPATAAVTQHFVRVANRQKLFDNPAIVEVFGIGQSAGLFYAVTEWLEGTTLQRYLERHGAMPLEEALNLLLPCIEGLAAAHAVGIVHGDLRLENIFISRPTRFEPQRARVDHFGVGGWPGKPAFIRKRVSQDIAERQFVSPEELQGESPDERSDVYAMAVVLYTVLAGRPPFAAGAMDELTPEIMAGTWTPLSEAAPTPGVSGELEQIVARAMALEPVERFQNMSELLEALRQIGGRSSSTALVTRETDADYTWIRPGSEELAAILFHVPELAPEELSAKRRQARNGRILRASALLSCGMMVVSLLLRMHEPTRATRAPRKRAAAAHEVSGLTAANQLPAPDHRSSQVDAYPDVSAKPQPELSTSAPQPAPALDLPQAPVSPRRRAAAVQAPTLPPPAAEPAQRSVAPTDVLDLMQLE